jgi:hypothetical protein
MSAAWEDGHDERPGSAAKVIYLGTAARDELESELNLSRQRARELELQAAAGEDLLDREQARLHRELRFHADELDRRRHRAARLKRYEARTNHLRWLWRLSILTAGLAVAHFLGLVSGGGVTQIVGHLGALPR